MKRIYLLLLLVLFAVGSAFSQRPAPASRLYFDHFDVKTGLPAIGIYVVKQDAEGYIWLASLIGFVRYDGYRFKVYEMGSPKTNISFTTEVVSVFFDKNNTMWVGLEGNGLCRYDRRTDTFEQFLYPNVGINTYFYARAEDKDGNIWGEYNADDKIGVAKFDVKTRRFEVFGNWVKGSGYINASSDFTVNKMAGGTVLVGCNNGMYVYTGPGIPLKSYFTTNDTAKRLSVNPVYEAPSEPGILWMNVFHGEDHNARIARFDIKKNALKEFKAGETPQSEKSDTVSSIYEDKKKQLWFATSQGLSKLDRATGKFTNYTPKDSIRAESKNSLSDFTETAEGGFWLSSPAGLVYFDTASGRFQRYRRNAENPETISSNTVRDKIIDNTNTLWVGDEGIDRVNKLKSAFKIYNKMSGNLSAYPGGDGQINALADGTCLVTSGKSLYRWTPGGDGFKKVYSLNKQSIHLANVIQSKRGVIYATTTTGLLAYDIKSGHKEQFRFSARDSASISANPIGTVYEDHAGTIWVGTIEKGICAFNPLTKKFTRFKFRVHRERITAANSGWLDDKGVDKIYEDRENNLWVGSIYGGLNVFNRRTNKFTSYLDRKNDGMELVNNMLEDKKGRFWVSSYLNGLFEFDRKTGSIVRRINERSGLLFNGVLGIQEDNQGRIWVLTERGLSRIDPETYVIKNFPTGVILPGFDVRGIHAFESGDNIGSVFLNKLPDGEFAFGLTKGIAVFNPVDLADDHYAPIVHIEDITSSNPLSDNNAKHYLRYGRKSLELSYDQNRLQFNYVGLQYNNPSENTYAYKLEGYDKQWVQAGKTRTITYTNLSPRKYVFRVRAADDSGVWNNTGDNLAIIIFPPWWFTWWAWVIYIALFAFAVFAFIAYRSRKLTKANRLLEEKISIRTKQLSDANRELSEQQEEIVTQRDRLAESITSLKATQNQLIQSEKMASLGELTAGIAHEIQNPLNFVNNFSEVSIELLDELKEEANAGNNEEVIAIAGDLTQNLEKIHHHGKRADFIVKGMLQHSRSGTGERQLTNINVLADEFFKLSFHGLRARDKNFNAQMTTHFDQGLPKIEVVQQDIGRVLLNLFNNAFYAVNQKAKVSATGYKPTVEVSTKLSSPSLGAGTLVIIVRDNGTGIPDAIKEKIMQPFFTTKPTGEGTGLGLSLTYDMVVKGHGGSIAVETKEGEFTEFTVSLPLS